MGHARALLSIEKPSLQLRLYNEILKKGLSVRQVEQRAKQIQQEADAAEENPGNQPARRPAKDYDILQKHLSNAFGIPVKLTSGAGGKGKLTFSFKNEAELEKIISLFDRLKN